MMGGVVSLWLLPPQKGKSDFKYMFNPIDPNPAISAHVVFPQSGHIRPEKRPFFQKKSYFSKIEP